jgi:hypothetical protein
MLASVSSGVGLSPARAVRIAVPDAVAMFEYRNSPRQNAMMIHRAARLRDVLCGVDVGIEDDAGNCRK